VIGRNGYPDHYNQALAFSAILYPASRGLSLRAAFLDSESQGGGRAYHVPRLYLSGLGRVFPPVARHLRQGIGQPLNLATCLLAQA
jgi:hypothetical protein